MEAKNKFKKQAQYFANLKKDLLEFFFKIKNLNGLEAELLLSLFMRDTSLSNQEELDNVLSKPAIKKCMGKNDSADDFVMDAVEINNDTINLMEKRVAHFAKQLLITQAIKEATNE